MKKNGKKLITNGTVIFEWISGQILLQSPNKTKALWTGLRYSLKYCIIITGFKEAIGRWNKWTKNSWIGNGSKSVRRFHVLGHFCWLYFWIIITKLASKFIKLYRIIEIIIQINLSSFWQSNWKKFVRAPRAPPWHTFKCKLFQCPIKVLLTNCTKNTGNTVF